MAAFDIMYPETAKWATGIGIGVSTPLRIVAAGPSAPI